MVTLFDLKKIQPIIGYTIPIVTILSTIKLVFYFGRFNVDIVNYISFSELLLTFMDDIAYFLSIYIPILIVTYFIHYKSFTYNAQIHLDGKSKNFQYRISKHFRRNWFEYCFSLLMVILTISLNKRVDAYFVVLFLGYPLIGLITLFIDEAFIIDVQRK